MNNISKLVGGYIVGKIHGFNRSMRLIEKVIGREEMDEHHDYDKDAYRKWIAWQENKSAGWVDGKKVNVLPAFIRELEWDKDEVLKSIRVNGEKENYDPDDVVKAMDLIMNNKIKISKSGGNRLAPSLLKKL